MTGHYHRAPMFGALPDRIPTDQLLANGGRIRGDIPLTGLKRLAGVNQGDSKAVVHADLRLELDSQGRYWLDGRISTYLALRCERCLELMEWPLDVTIKLFLVPDESSGAELQEQADYTVIKDGLGLHELIEDELILALPLVPKHAPGTDCGDKAGKGPVAESGERNNPFAILGKLKT